MDLVDLHPDAPCPSSGIALVFHRKDKWLVITRLEAEVSRRHACFLASIDPEAVEQGRELVRIPGKQLAPGEHWKRLLNLHKGRTGPTMNEHIARAFETLAAMGAVWRLVGRDASCFTKDLCSLPAWSGDAPGVVTQLVDSWFSSSEKDKLATFQPRSEDRSGKEVGASAQLCGVVDVVFEPPLDLAAATGQPLSAVFEALRKWIEKQRSPAPATGLTQQDEHSYGGFEPVTFRDGKACSPRALADVVRKLDEPIHRRNLPSTFSYTSPSWVEYIASPGDGKTILGHQLCYDAYQMGLDVYWLDAKACAESVQYPSVERHALFVVDNAHCLPQKVLDELLAKRPANGTGVLLGRFSRLFCYPRERRSTVQLRDSEIIDYVRAQLWELAVAFGWTGELEQLLELLVRRQPYDPFITWEEAVELVRVVRMTEGGSLVARLTSIEMVSACVSQQG